MLDFEIRDGCVRALQGSIERNGILFQIQSWQGLVSWVQGSLRLWFEPQGAECNEATVISRAGAVLGGLGRWKEGAGGRPRASHI